MIRKYMFKKFESLITSCRKHPCLNSNLRDIIVKIISMLEESEVQFGFTYGILCIEKTYGIVDLIIRYCNIHLFKCNESDYIQQSIEVNKLLKDICCSLDSIQINKSKITLLKNINDCLYSFAFKIQNIVLYNIEKEEMKWKETERKEMIKEESERQKMEEEEIKTKKYESIKLEKNNTFDTQFETEFEFEKNNTFDTEFEFEDHSTLINSIIEYFDKEFENSKEDIYKFIDEH